MINYYKILGLENFATGEAIKAAHRRLCMKYHPDLNNGDKHYEEKFKEIQHAYEYLRNPVTKELHDHQLRYGYTDTTYDDTSSAEYSYPPPEAPRRGWFSGTFGGFPISIAIILGFRLWSGMCNAYDYPKINTMHISSPGTEQTIPSIPAHIEVRQQSFKEGTPQALVRIIQGPPTEIKKYLDEEIWSYGNSTVIFKNELVIRYTNTDGNLLVSKK